MLDMDFSGIAENIIKGKYDRESIYYSLEEQYAREYDVLVSLAERYKANFGNEWPYHLICDSEDKDCKINYSLCAEKELTNNQLSALEKEDYCFRKLEHSIELSGLLTSQDSSNLNKSDFKLIAAMHKQRCFFLRGSLWSQLGVEIEQQVWLQSMLYFGVPLNNYRGNTIGKCKRRVDAALFDRQMRWHQAEIKINGDGNTEPLDSAKSRGIDLVIATCISDQQREWLEDQGILCLELNERYRANLEQILMKLDIPYDIEKAVTQASKRKFEQIWD